MSDLTKFSEGASILQQVDVSDIFTNLAMGIAEAQQKLDDNSIAQAIKLAETNIDGESLLSLGFAPVFYAFQYADISASINLQMGLKEALEFGFGIDVQLSNLKGYSAFNRTFLSSNSYSETSEEYKSVRQLNFRAKEKKAIKINNKFISQSEYLDAKTRLEDFKHKIQSETTVDQVYEEIESRSLTENNSRGVDVFMDGGFIRIEPSLHFAITGGVGLLRVADFNAPSTTIDLDGPTSTTSTTFSLTNAGFNNAFLDSAVTGAGSGATVYALTKEGNLFVKSGGSWVEVSSKIYFGYNSDEITYGKNLKDGPNDSANLEYPYVSPIVADDNENHDQHPLIHKVLRFIQSHDSDASITITGMTDPKGGDNPKNKSLAKRRAEKLRDHIFGSSAPINVEIGAVTNTNGPSNLIDRHATIELNSNYVIIIGANVKKVATTTPVGPNKFVYLDESTATEGPFNKLNVQYGSISLAISDNSFTNIWNTAKTKLTNHRHEATSDQLHYSLDNEAIVKLHLLSNDAEEISIEENSESSSNGSENQSSYLWAKTKNESNSESESSSNNNQSSSFAFSASVDFRMSRQFEMSMEGNSSMSARLVSLPAPDAFRAFLDRKYGSSTEG
ncbi:hypothetical protein [Fluviicola sp.]|uniref:hypothetical protein n=1 Tax=Fluviicola sp. TaxID=1917219 RepID=UPI0031D6C8B7